ncbi:MAG TPA: ribosomal protein S18-alanine N-acetyltransferase [Chthonomonadales bacterium]|nr:ribosomal protein S18-alanine N-acetyltransferase [Chthonomonadales bacterium]
MAIIIDPVSIEPMRRSDIPAVSVIEHRCYTTPWQENAYYTELSNRFACYLVARLDGQIVGYGGMWVIMDEAHITTLAVDPPYRRRKIGERLLLELMEAAIARGASRATLEVREHNIAAQNLYRKYGFREAAIRKNYYTDNQENAIVMWADDIRAPAYAARLQELRYRLHREYDEYLRNRDELR